MCCRDRHIGVLYSWHLKHYERAKGKLCTHSPSAFFQNLGHDLNNPRKVEAKMIQGPVARRAFGDVGNRAIPVQGPKAPLKPGEISRNEPTKLQKPKAGLSGLLARWVLFLSGINGVVSEFLRLVIPKRIRRIGFMKWYSVMHLQCLLLSA